MNTSRLSLIIINMVGLASAVVTIYAAQEKLRLYIVLGLFIVIPLLIIFDVFFYLRTRPKQPSITREYVKLSRTSYLVRPATDQDIVWIANLELKWFHRDAVPEDILKEWYNANPNAFFVIETKGGDRVGHVDILPIKPPTLARFLDGKITETGIRGDSLYSPAEKEEVKTLYVESLIIDLPIYQRGLAFNSLLSDVDKIVSGIANTDNIEYVYAMAATSQGANTIGEFGFLIAKNARERPDHHDVYAAKYSDFKNLIAQLEA